MEAGSKILSVSEENLNFCANRLKSDDLVAVPTETVYGLGGNSLREDAVRKIFEVKGRPLVDPLISHFSNTESAFEHVYASTESHQLADAFWPGPLTLILPKRDSIPDLVTAGLPSAGIRVPAHPIFRALLTMVDFPVAAPSANPFGYVSPTRAEHVERTLGAKITAILDGGPCSHGLESTIVDLRTEGKPAILRPGPISEQELSETLGGIKIYSAASRNADNEAQVAPGLLSRHYSPKALLKLFEPGGRPESGLHEFAASETSALVLQSRPKNSEALGNHIYWLSEDNSLETVGRNLFNLLQKLEIAGYREIQLERPKDSGLGIALNDRLNRAAVQK